MAVSETDIVNAALRLIGAGRITSLTEGSKNANVANDLYEITRDDLLRSHNWNFATKRTTLARSSTAPASEFAYGYVLPANWIRTVSVHDNDAGVGTVAHRTEELADAGVILSNAETLYLRYIYRATDPNRLSADFVSALEIALARDLAPGVANASAARVDQLERRAQQVLARAKSVDAQGSMPEMRPVGSWVSSRGAWR